MKHKEFENQCHFAIYLFQEILLGLFIHSVQFLQHHNLICVSVCHFVHLTKETFTKQLSLHKV
jgi:hypothetical protein